MHSVEIGLMFKRVERRLEAHKGKWLLITVDGQEVSVPTGETVAAALMLMGQSQLRSSVVSGSARAPYCLMGVCFECLVTIDGVRNRQACMVQVVDGMVVERQL